MFGSLIRNKVTYLNGNVYPYFHQIIAQNGQNWCSYAQTYDPVNVLEYHNKNKKIKYLDLFFKQQQHFTPFYVSTNGMLGRKDTTLARIMELNFSHKWKRPYSNVCGNLNARM